MNFVVEGSSPAIPTLPAAGEPSEIDKAVASYVVPEIVDGSTLQLGIGGMPNAIGAAIADSDLKDLGIHTEMLVDAYYKMFQAGKITNSKKNIDKGRGVFGFAQGSSELYEWARENPGLVSAPIDYCNDPYNMALYSESLLNGTFMTVPADIPLKAPFSTSLKTRLRITIVFSPAASSPEKAEAISFVTFIL